MKVIAGDVEVRIGADDAGLSRGLKRADKAVAGFSSRAKSLIGVATKIQAIRQLGRNCIVKLPSPSTDITISIGLSAPHSVQLTPP